MSDVVDTFRHPHLAKDYYSNGQVPGEGGLPLEGAAATFGQPVSDAVEVAPEQPPVQVTTPPAVEAANGAPAPEAPTLSNAEISNLLTDNGIEHNARGNKAYLTDLATQAGLPGFDAPSQA